MQVVKLTNGIEVPLIGLGTNTFGKHNHNWNGELNFDTREIENALEVGYKFFDTAIVYRNEAVLGLAYKSAKVFRHHIFLQTKLPTRGNYIKDEETIREAIGESLHKLSTSYIDVVLIHQPRPVDEENLRVYRVLEKLVDEGKINAIGVSNFSISQLDYLLKHARIKPAINQIEIHPGYWNEELVNFCQEQGVLVQAWSPLFRTANEYRDVLVNIGKKYNKTWAQVVIRYLTQKGIMVIAKSHDKQRQEENINVFDFELSAEDNALIASLNKPTFPKLGILGGTGFVGAALSSEALRLGYEVTNVSLDARLVPANHLIQVKKDITKEDVSSDLKDVDYLIASLNGLGDEYMTVYKAAVEVAKKIQKPLVVIGTYANLFLKNSYKKVLETLEGEEKESEAIKASVLDLLKEEKDLKWTYISPSRVVDKYHLHHDYNLGSTFLLENRHGESIVSVIDLVDFALDVASKQDKFDKLQLTICNR